MFKTGWLIPFLTLLLLIFSGCETIKYPACENDKHCKNKNKERPNEVCVNKTCVECRDNSQCADGYLCKENQCKPECSTDADCESPKICKEQKCQYECTQDGDCDDGYVCKEYKCEVKLECTQNFDCDAGMICEENKCIKPVTKIKNTVEIPECTLEKVNFDFNEYILTSNARDILEKNVECIKQKNQPILIEGHCDERGTEEYNLNLGEKRANAIKKHLKSLGVDVSIRVVSKGEEEPLDSSSNEDAWSKNRRGELIPE